MQDVAQDEEHVPAGPHRSLNESASGNTPYMGNAFESGPAPQTSHGELPAGGPEQSFGPGAADDKFCFDALIGVGDVPSTSQTDDFGSIAPYIETFDGFEPATMEIPSGVYELGIEESMLRTLVTMTSYAVHGSGTMSWVELRLQNGRLRARSFNRDIFADCAVNILDAPQTETFAPIAVVHDELARALAGVVLDARLWIDGPGKTLIVRSHGFERPIRLQDASKFVAPTPTEIGNTDPETRRTVQRELLRASLAYLAPFANPDRMQGSCGYVELREGILHSSTSTASARVRASAFPDWTARIPFAALQVLPRVLDQFPENVDLLSTGRFLVLVAEDLRISFGVGTAQRPSDHEGRFVIASEAAPEEGRDRILVTRSPLMQGLTAQRSLGRPQTQWVCVGTGSKARCEFRAGDADGKRVVFPIGVSRQDGVDGQRRADLPLPELLASLQHDVSQYASLDLYWDGRQMRIAGPDLPGAIAEATIAISLPRKVK